MEPGIYTGQDGRLYRWVLDGKAGAWVEVNWAGFWAAANIMAADWPAAKAALDALIGEEAGEWVEWETGGLLIHRYRATRDGSRVEYADHDGRWFCCNTVEAPAYRKGREVALEEVRELAISLVSLEGEAWTCPLCSCVMDDTHEPVHRARA